jgi:hypothetical protein
MVLSDTPAVIALLRQENVEKRLVAIMIVQRKNYARSDVSKSDSLSVFIVKISIQYMVLN